MQPDLIPTLPKIDINKYDYEDEDFAITDFKKAERKIMMYENKEGRMCILFNKLDDLFYADFVVGLARPITKVKILFEFLKLCIEGTRSAMLCTQKGYSQTVKIGKYLRKNKEA